MDSNLDVKSLVSLILRSLLDLLDGVDHVKTCLDHSVSLVENDSSSSLVLVDSSIVAHDHILVTISIDFINFPLLT